jgi:CRISPR system Cascade subunit CasD
MSTLLLRLAAPIQSWGLEDKFERRGTAREPTKSGVLGLLAAALGRGRDEPLDDLCALRFGVRIDQPGQLLRDFHTAHVEGEKDNQSNPVSRITQRYYLSDAVFLAGVEGDEALLLALDEAVRHPFYPLFLGRRSCPPEGRVSLGVKNASLEDALRGEEWQAAGFYQRREKQAKLTLVLDAEQPGILRRRDAPLSFSQRRRTHTFRYVDDLAATVPVCIKGSHSTDHDPFADLEE